MDGSNLLLADLVLSVGLDPELFFGLGEPDPQLPPGRELLLVREVGLHLGGGVPRVERSLVDIVNSQHLGRAIAMTYRQKRRIKLKIGEPSIFSEMFQVLDPDGSSRVDTAQAHSGANGKERRNDSGND